MLEFIDNFIGLISNSLILACFAMLPVWFLICITGYILQINKCPKTSLIMPLSLLITLFTLLNYSLTARSLYDDMIFGIVMVACLGTLIGIYLCKKRYKHHLYFALFLFILFSIMTYIYL